MARSEEDEISRGDLTSIVSTETATTTTVGDYTSMTVSEPATSMKHEQFNHNDTPEKEPRFCGTGYCANIRFFVACISLVFVLRGALLQYSEDVIGHVGRRYPITAAELDFLVGCERIGFVCTLIFVAFFGNRMNKPIAITVGVFICAFGSILVAVPFFITGPRLYDTQVSHFVTAGLCNQIPKNISFQTQCDLIPNTGEKGGPTFSLIATANVLIGLGSALFSSLGLVYIDESSKPSRMPIHLGIVMAMHAFGRFLGALLAVWFTSLPEAINVQGSDKLKQTFAIFDQEKIGRWWLGFPVFASLFIIIAFFMVWFPKHIVVPDWVSRQRARKAEIKAERERRHKLRVQASKKRNSSNADGSRRKDGNGKNRKKSGNTAENGARKARSKNGQDRHSGAGKYQKKNKSSRNRKSDNGELVEVTIDDISGGNGLKADLLNSKTSLNDSVHPKNHAANQNGDIQRLEMNGEPIGDVSEIQADDTLGESTSEVHNNAAFTSIESIDDKGSDTADSLDVNMEDLNEDREKDFADTNGKNGLRRRQRQPHGSAVTDGKTNNRNLTDDSKSEASRATRRSHDDTKKHGKTRRRRRIRGIRTEKLEDLPRSIVKILKNLLVLFVMIGAILGGFLLTGYIGLLPDYIRTQFARSWTNAILITGVAGPLAWTVGALLGAVVIYKLLEKPLWYAVIVIVSCLAISAALVALAIAFNCPHRTTVDLTEKNVSKCTLDCECESIKVQYEPLCGADGRTYPSPCHAGCKHIFPTPTAGIFNFTDCLCVPGGHAVQGVCTPPCGQLAGFVIFVFLAVVAASICIVPIFVILFRDVRGRNRSLAVGFVIWAVYLLAQATSPVVFGYVRDGRCKHWGQDCLEEPVCWRYDLLVYRYAYNGTAVAFLVSAICPFLIVLWRLRRQHISSTKGKDDTKIEEPAVTDDNTATELRATEAPPFVVHVNEAVSPEKTIDVSANGITSSPL